MKDMTRQHKLAFGLASAITVVLTVVLGLWLATKLPTRPEPIEEQNADHVPVEVIFAGLAYVKTLPWLNEQSSVVYQRADTHNDKVIGLVYTGSSVLEGIATKQTYLVLSQDGQIIGHEARISDEAGEIELLSPEPGQILPRNNIIVRAYAKVPEQAVRLRVRRGGVEGDILYEAQQLSAESRLVVFTVPTIARGRGELMLSLSTADATLQIPVSLEQAAP